MSAEQEIDVMKEFGLCDDDATSYLEHALAREIMRLREALDATEAERNAMQREMLDRMNKLHRVLGDPYGHLTKEVERLSRILAALRNPSEAMVKAVDTRLVHALTRGDVFRELIIRAVKAAEQEASDDAR